MPQLRRQLRVKSQSIELHLGFADASCLMIDKVSHKMKMRCAVFSDYSIGLLLQAIEPTAI